MGGGNDSPSNTTTTQKLDPFIKEQVRGNLDFVNGIIDKGYTPYQGPGVAGLNQTTQQGIQGLGQMAQNNPYQGLLNQASQGVQGVAGYQPQQVQQGQLAEMDMSQFQNPHTDQVVNQAMQDIDRSRQMAVNQTQDQAISAGAFGGNRSGIAEAETNRNFADRAAAAAGQLRSQGFNTALGAAQNQQQMQQQQQGLNQQAQVANQQAGLDQNRLGLLANNALAGYAQQGNAMQAGNYQNAINAGQIAQGNQQAQNDWQYQMYQNAQNWPIQMANLRTSAIGGSPAGGSTTQTAPGGGTNKSAAALGGAMSGASTGFMLSGGNPIGAAVGGGVGLLGGMFG